jgi:hypothetical protein
MKRQREALQNGEIYFKISILWDMIWEMDFLEIGSGNSDRIDSVSIEPSCWQCWSLEISGSWLTGLLSLPYLNQGRLCIEYHRSSSPCGYICCNLAWTVEVLPRGHSWRTLSGQKHQWSIEGNPHQLEGQVCYLFCTGNKGTTWHKDTMHQAGKHIFRNSVCT